MMGRRLAVVLLLALVVPIVAIGPTGAAPGEDATPAANPDLERACGLDILVVIDESQSIYSADAVDSVRDAFNAFTQALQNTGSRMAVVDFETTATLPIPYTTVTTQTKQTIFDPFINDVYDPGAGGRTKRTNWEDGFRVGRFFAPRPSQQQPHLVVFLTDGDPNTVVDTSRVPYDPGSTNFNQNRYELDPAIVPDTDTTNTNSATATEEAVPNSNAMKAAGSHVLAVAFGAALNNNDSLGRLIDMSGPDVWNGTGPFDISTTDVARVAEYDELEAALRAAAFALCSPSVTVEKLVDHTPDPGTDDAIPQSGWDMTLTAVPRAGGFDWVLPANATGDTATVATGADGFATFQWNTTLPVVSDITVVEDDPGLQGLENDPSQTACVFRTPDSPDDAPLPTTVRDGEFDAAVPDDSIVTCSFLNRALPEPAVTLEKYTNGFDADTPPGPAIPTGETITWSYTITNTGNVTLDIVLDDDQLGAVTCPQPTLAPGADMVCETTGTSVAGDYANVGTVTGTDPFGTDVTDTDPSHYFGTRPGIDVEKYTVVDDSGQRFDADVPPGPIIPVGDQIHFEYDVANTGNVALDTIALDDDQLGAVTCPQTTLAPGATMTCTTASQAVVAGLYTNVATVTGVDTVDAITLTDSDPSNHFGEDPGITIEKSTNGQDADTPTGPTLAVGDAVTWGYEVTNTGNVPLGNWQVTDDQLGAVACPRIAIIAPGQTVVCSAGGTAEPGQYQNTGVVQAQSPSGETVGAEDPSHYLGVDANITIEKSTNGYSDDAPPGIFIPVGDPVTWTYEVTTTGNDPVTVITVLDSRFLLSPPDPVEVGGYNVGDTNQNDLLEIGETWLYEATGTSVAGQYSNFSGVVGRGQVSGLVYDIDPSHYFGADPGIHLEKLTNGADADTPAQAPYIEVGAEVTWDYLVTNTGNVGITDLDLVDDQLGAITCPGTDLDPAETMVCDATGTATQGLYANTATVTGEPVNQGATLTDDDPSHYIGYITGINIEKATNGEDADSPTGPLVPVGDPVTWTYVVTPNDVPVYHVEVTDDQGATPVFVDGDTNGDDILDIGETWTYEATGTATAGQYENTGTVNGVDALEDDVTDDDPSHYLGYVSEIVIEKATNGADADTPTGPDIPVGDPVTWTYVVTGGDIPITDVVVSDDQGVTPVFVDGDTDGDDALDPGETWTYEAMGTAEAGQYENTGTVAGTDSEGTGLTDSDPSHYFGSGPAIEIEKGPDDAVVEYGADHTFEITVTNTGNVDLDDVGVTDTITPACDREIGDLAVGDSVTYTCVYGPVTGNITNTATATGTGTGTDVTVTDEDEATVEVSAGPGDIGDLVWHDLDGDGIQDSGEPGISGVRIVLTPNSPLTSALRIGSGLASGGGAPGAALVGVTAQTVTPVEVTNTDGDYLFADLTPGAYTVAIDMTTVPSGLTTLTTAGSYQITLAAGESFLDADFGLVGASLPHTGADVDRITLLGIVMLLMGGAMATATRRRRIA